MTRFGPRVIWEDSFLAEDLDVFFQKLAAHNSELSSDAIGKMTLALLRRLEEGEARILVSEWERELPEA